MSGTSKPRLGKPLTRPLASEKTLVLEHPGSDNNKTPKFGPSGTLVLNSAERGDSKKTPKSGPHGTIVLSSAERGDSSKNLTLTQSGTIIAKPDDTVGGGGTDGAASSGSIAEGNEEDEECAAGQPHQGSTSEPNAKSGEN